ncbi:MAG: hypothetical protein HY080_04090 [Gammaproteobacteria bacterium]|nr:hypothetical protein [Gammaproteobacteria bacterium]
MLLLTVPAQHSADNPAVERDPKRVKAWLAQLPIDKAVETVEKLIAALRPLNELRIEPGTRLKLLETYHTAFENLLFTYDELHLRSLPLSFTERRKLSDDIMWVYLELANGYKSIVKGAYDAVDQNSHRSEIHLAIYRAIELIANALLHTFREHRPAPPLAILEIHQLYHLAERYQIQNHSIASVKGIAQSATIQRIYKQIMLIIAADPYGYDGKQLYELFMLLEEYTDSCQLLTGLPEQDKSLCFSLDFSEDHGPQVCQHQPRQGGQATQRVLNIKPAILRIIDQVNKGKNVAVDSGRARELRLLRLFIHSLQHGGIERVTRKHCQEQARVAYGLEASCYYLQNRDRFIDTSVESSNGIEVRDIAAFEAEHELSMWRVGNTTPTGRLFVAAETDQAKIAVGEIISVVEQLSEQQQPLVNTGIIRWLRYEDSKAYIGVQVLNNLPIAVTCQLEGGQVHDPTIYNALYFPSDKDHNQPASLLFEFNVFRLAQQFRVQVAGQHYRVVAVKIIMETPVHIQFGFKVIQ